MLNPVSGQLSKWMWLLSVPVSQPSALFLIERFGAAAQEARMWCWLLMALWCLPIADPRTNIWKERPTIFFFDLARKNCAAVLSARKFLEWKLSSRVDCDAEGRSLEGAKSPSLAVGEWQAKHEGVERSADGNTMSSSSI